MSAAAIQPFPDLSPVISQYFTMSFVDSTVLLPEELDLLEGASIKRIADLSTGRHCARNAMEALIGHRPAVLRGHGREPIWPQGVVGSIAHSAKMAGAMIAMKSDFSAIGIDIETVGDVRRELWDLMFDDQEQQLILSKENPDVWATLLFSLKEAFYKLQYPITGKFLDLTDVSIADDNGDIRFKLTSNIVDLKGIDLTSIRSRWTIINDQLITICFITA
jgi:4'-phosphopantetheinyl transferase EntD